MNLESENNFINASQVEPEIAKEVLANLNSIRSAVELAEVVGFTQKKDAGIKIAQNLLNKRESLGGFKNLRQVAAVPQVGPDRFSRIVRNLSWHKKKEEKGKTGGKKKKTDDSSKLDVYTVLHGIEIARTSIDTQGRYRMSFEYRPAMGRLYN